jgi:hypothetical protein
VTPIGSYRSFPCVAPYTRRFALLQQRFGDRASHRADAAAAPVTRMGFAMFLPFAFCSLRKGFEFGQNGGEKFRNRRMNMHCALYYRIRRLRIHDVQQNVNYFIVDHDSAGRMKSGMALDHRTIFQSSQPFLYAPVRPSGNFILACFNTFHIDADIAIDSKTIFGTSASNMGRVRAGNERLCWYTSRIDTGATKLVAFNNGDRHARIRKPRSQRRTCLAGPDNDGIELSRHEAPSFKEDRRPLGQRPLQSPCAGP